MAGGLASLGVRPSYRVATFMWNNTEHLEVYTAQPSTYPVVEETSAASYRPEAGPHPQN